MTLRPPRSTRSDTLSLHDVLPIVESVTPLGVGGEALPSIASVARLTLDSRTPGGDGWRRIVDNGALAGAGPTALARGTRVLVEDLFARVPAGRKFLRSANSEYAPCLDIVRLPALTRPHIGPAVAPDRRRDRQRVVQGKGV